LVYFEVTLHKNQQIIIYDSKVRFLFMIVKFYHVVVIHTLHIFFTYISFYHCHNGHLFSFLLMSLFFPSKNTIIYSLILASTNKQCILHTFSCFYAFSMAVLVQGNFYPFSYIIMLMCTCFCFSSFNISWNWSSTNDCQRCRTLKFWGSLVCFLEDNINMQ